MPSYFNLPNKNQATKNEQKWTNIIKRQKMGLYAKKQRSGFLDLPKKGQFS